MTDWLDFLVTYRNNSTPCVLVTVVETFGSVPRSVGVKMAIGMDATAGTVGGGALELKVIEISRNLLIKKGGPEFKVIRPDAQDETRDEQCMPAVKLYFEPLFVTSFEIFIFGAGHVGKALAHVLAPLSCRLHWIDTRPDLFPPSLPGNIFVHSDADFRQAILKAPENSFFLAMTHSHALDFEICEAILLRGDAAYCGMIGSARKRRQFERYLAKQGQPSELLEKLTCPMGVAQIKGREPAEIAIAIAAELLQIREAREAKPIFLA